MSYIEPHPTKRHIWALAALFPILYLINLGVIELQSNEALQASVAAEIISDGHVLLTTIGGEQVPTFPMYPWLVTICSGFQRPNEWTTRLPAVLAVLGMALVSGWVARRSAGDVAGIVAAGMVLTNAAFLREGVRAGSETVFAFFIVCAWFSWYDLGRMQKRWGLAWFAAILFVLAATFTVGVRAIAYFYLPLFFLRRPLRAWRRMLLPAHFAAFALLLGGILLWLAHVPGQSLLPWSVLALRALPSDTGGYLRDLVDFPIKCLAYMLPWTLLAWPGFCIAYRPLEKAPVLCHFLRTLILPIFLAAWFLPNVSSRSLLPLVCPLAVLTAQHYGILVRRHSSHLITLYRLLAAVAVVLGSVLLFLALMKLAGLMVLEGMEHWTVLYSLLLLASAVGAAHWCHRARHSPPLWMRLMLAIACLRLAYLAVGPTIEAWLHSEQRNGGRVLAAAVPENATVLKTFDWLLVRHCFYTHRKITIVTDLEAEMPQDAPTVYVMGSGSPPVPASRQWTPVSPPLDPRARNRVEAQWYPNRRCFVRLRVVPREADSTEQTPVIVRMYRGDLRTTD